MLNAAGACLVSPDDRDTGVAFTPDRANAVRIKMMNHTDSAKMRLWWQTDGTPEWKEENSVAFDVKPQDEDGNFVHSEYTEGQPAKVEWPGYTELWKETVAREAGDVLKVKE
jgi:hypothetical protein